MKGGIPSPQEKPDRGAPPILVGEGGGFPSLAWPGELAQPPRPKGND